MTTTTKQAPAAIDLGNLDSLTPEQLRALVKKQADENEALKKNQRTVLTGEPQAKVKKAEQAKDPKTKELLTHKDGSPKMSGGKLGIYGINSATFPITLRNGRQIERMFEPKRVLAFMQAGLRDFDNFLFESEADTAEKRAKEIADERAHTKEVLTRLVKTYGAVVEALAKNAK